MANKNSNNKQSAEEILKKIQQQTPDQKMLKTREILEGKVKPVLQQRPKVNYMGIIINAYSSIMQKFHRKLANPETQKKYIFTAFFIFSSIVAWKVEAKYDNLKKKATKTKTFKQAEIQRENEYINKFLSDKPFEPVPINDEPQPKTTYNYEMEENVLDTRDDLLQQIAKDYKQGMTIDQNLLQELKAKGFV